MSARRARSSSRARTRRESDWQVLRPDGSTCWLALGRAGSFAERLLGLLGGPAPAPGHGLLLAPCRAVHSFGMHVSIDLVFVDEPGRVLATVEGFRPWRVAFCPRARSTVELRAGEAKRLRISPGCRLMRGASEVLRPLQPSDDLRPLNSPGRALRRGPFAAP